MINKKPLISVIIPIYNGEKWLSISLSSILEQTFADFEILLVNDGSIDTSEKICQGFLKKDNRIRYFYKKNSGVSSARNLGLEKALGKYIYFFDCDDIIAPDTLEFLLTLLEKSGADIASCSFRHVFKQAISDTVKDTKNTQAMIKTLNEKYDNGDIFTHLLKCKLFSRLIIGNSRFSEQIHYSEDDLFATEVFIKAKCVVYSPVVKVFYYIHDESSTHKTQPYSYFQGFVLAKCLIKEKIYAATNNKNVRDLVYRDYCTSIFSLFRYVVHASDKTEYELLHKKYSAMLEDFLVLY